MKDDPEFKGFISYPPLRQVNRFGHIEYEVIKTGLAKFAAEHGYFSGRFSEHKIAMDLDAYEVHVPLHYDRGVRYRFGYVTLQQGTLEPKLLKRYIPFKK